MAFYGLDLSDSERTALLDLLRNQGPDGNHPDICRMVFMKLQSAEAKSELDLPEIEEGAICESCQ